MLEEHLTRGEKLYLQRKRFRQNSADSAARHDVSVEQYRRWEIDAETGPDVFLGGIELREHYAIMRRRMGLTLQDLADRMGCSINTVSRAESGNGPLTRVIEYWGD